MSTTPESVKGLPEIVGNPSPDLRADHNDIIEWLLAEADESAANHAGMPSTGNWNGRKRWNRALKVLEVWDSVSGWVNAVPVDTTIASLLQLDGVDSAPRVTLQHGVGKIQGDNSTDISEAVVFGTPFTNLRSLTVDVMGSRTSGSFNPNGLIVTGGYANSSAASGTGFTACLFAPGATFNSANDYYFSYQAYGVL